MGRRSQGTAGSINYGVQLSGHAKLEARNLAVGDSAKIESNEVGISATELLRALRRDIDELPVEHSKVKAELEIFRNALETEAQKPEPNRSFWNINSKGLIESARTVASIAPAILQTAERVAHWFAGLSS
jgi:hypothetical protein